MEFNNSEFPSSSRAGKPPLALRRPVAAEGTNGAARLTRPIAGVLVPLWSRHRREPWRPRVFFNPAALPPVPSFTSPALTSTDSFASAALPFAVSMNSPALPWRRPSRYRPCPSRLPSPPRLCPSGPWRPQRLRPPGAWCWPNRSLIARRAEADDHPRSQTGVCKDPRFSEELLGPSEDAAFERGTVPIGAARGVRPPIAGVLSRLLLERPLGRREAIGVVGGRRDVRVCDLPDHLVDTALGAELSHPGAGEHQVISDSGRLLLLHTETSDGATRGRRRLPHGVPRLFQPGLACRCAVELRRSLSMSPSRRASVSVPEGSANVSALSERPTSDSAASGDVGDGRSHLASMSGIVSLLPSPLACTRRDAEESPRPRPSPSWVPTEIDERCSRALRRARSACRPS